jgi:hypothetical protein
MKLNFQTMHTERAHFRKIARALESAAKEHDGTYPVKVTIDNFTVTTNDPLGASKKYLQAVKRATKPSGKARASKWTEKDEEHYRSVNGSPTTLAEDQHGLALEVDPAQAVRKQANEALIAMAIESTVYVIDLVRHTPKVKRVKPVYKIDLTRYH